ncbi:MAG: hypothetical protein ACM3PX_03080 [Omnitrophica WOR_2 bacterium]|jgi:hypothetical protein
MPLQAKHIVEEINGVRCTIVEKGTTPDRCNFLKGLLTLNNFEVLTDCKPNTEGIEICTIGVTDLEFNPVIAVYEMRLKTDTGSRVSPAYWDQKETTVIDQYWVSHEDVDQGKSPWHF